MNYAHQDTVSPQQATRPPDLELISSLIAECRGIANVTNEALDRACGASPPTLEAKPAAVPNGHLENIQDDLRRLREALEHACSRANRIA